MRKFWGLVCVLALIFSLAVTVNATQIPSMNATANVAADGKGQVTLALTFRLDSAVDNLYFPLPAGASGIRVNGSRVSASKDGDVLKINLRRFVKGVVGDTSVNIQYDLHGLVTQTEIGTLQLQLPLLSGFEYPISNLQFTVTLPGAVESLPAFTSGYHNASIEQQLTYEVEGTTIRGSALKQLKDRETLVMTLPVDDTMFPRVIVDTESTQVAWIGVGICAGLALLYWLLALRFVPILRRCTEAPEGFNAGQLGCILGSGGVNLTMMVFTWAQLGYVLIQPDRYGKVLLHKRMDMGNERSDTEQRCFRNLFGSRQMVDATGSRYAALAAQLAAKPAGVRELYHKRSGNPLFFRVLCGGAGLFAGGGIGAVLGSGAALQWFLIILLGALGGISGYIIPNWTDSGLFRNKRSLWLGVGLSVAWILLALVAGAAPLGLAMGLGLLVFGLLFGWSGRRSELGKLTAGQLLGLRHYLRGGDKEQLRHACESDPDYFFRMAPYAMALGVGKGFARAVGRKKLERCPYLTSGMDGHLDAVAWNEKLTETAKLMDARMQNRRIEKLLRIIQSITKPQ